MLIQLINKKKVHVKILRGRAATGVANVTSVVLLYVVLSFFTHTLDIDMLYRKNNCNTVYCIYTLLCPCSLVYVGKTIGRFKCHFQKHCSEIRVALESHQLRKPINPDKPVPIHFVQAHCQTHSPRSTVVDHVPHLVHGGDQIKLLLQKESYWIYPLINDVLSTLCLFDPAHRVLLEQYALYYGICMTVLWFFMISLAML